MLIGNKNFDTKNKVYIMGILNVTPDSFSDGGSYETIDKALSQAEKMILQGADIIDIGGESTRPGHIKISNQQEIDRVSPIIEKIKDNFDIPISLDSYKPEVIKANIHHIDLVNDIWGLKYHSDGDSDNNMAKIIADSKLPCCLMHNRKSSNYTNFFEDFICDMQESVDIALKAGISSDNIILDGGVGFVKSHPQNLEVIDKTDELCKLGFPVLIATSRKSVIGAVLDKTTEQRLFGTIATTVAGVLKGASFVRVHDIEENFDAIKIAKSIMEERIWTK